MTLDTTGVDPLFNKSKVFAGFTRFHHLPGKVNGTLTHFLNIMKTLVNEIFEESFMVRSYCELMHLSCKGMGSRNYKGK